MTEDEIYRAECPCGWSVEKTAENSFMGNAERSVQQAAKGHVGQAGCDYDDIAYITRDSEQPTPTCPECRSTRTRPLKSGEAAFCFDCENEWRGDFDV